MNDTGDQSGTNFKTMYALEFVRQLKDNFDKEVFSCVFFLGAGCSKTSGIPLASELVHDIWLPKLHWRKGMGSKEKVEKWAAKRFPGYTKENAATYYNHVIEELFPSPLERQKEIERLCDGKFPGFGYSVLASLMANASAGFNMTITTNFDDLIADALYLYADARPLVIPHESLAGYINPHSKRPLVVKLHGGQRLSPKNTVYEVDNIK